MTDAGDNIFFIDNDYAIQKISRKLSQKIGVSNGTDLVGKTCHEYFFHRDKPCDHCPVSRSITFQTVVEEDIRLDENDGSKGSRHAVATPVMDDNNQVRQVIVDCLGSKLLSNSSTVQPRDPGPENRSIPQLPVEEVETELMNTIGALLFDKDFNIILSNQWHKTAGFGWGENHVGRNLFSVAPFYNQAPVRKKIKSFMESNIDGQILFHTKVDIYSENWLEHHLYRLVGQSKIDAYLIISKISRNNVFMDSRVRMAEKSAMLSRFASRISHDIKNPMALISTSMEFLKTDLAKANTLDAVYGLVDYMDQVQDQVNRVIDILDTVNALKVHSMDTVSKVDAEELLNRSVTIALLGKSFPNSDIRVKIAGPLPPIHVSEINIERAFSELFKSLLTKAGENGLLDINLAYIGDLDEMFVFKIHSNSVQKKVLDLDEMMHEFFSSGNQFNISNLGLAIAYATIINHSGEMHVLTLDSGELEILIKLPRIPQGS